MSTITKLVDFLQSLALYPALSLALLTIGLASYFTYLRYYKKTIHLNLFLISLMLLLKEGFTFLVYVIDLFPGGERIGWLEPGLLFVTTFATLGISSFLLLIFGFKKETILFAIANAALFLVFLFLYLFQRNNIGPNVIHLLLRFHTVALIIIPLVLISLLEMIEKPELDLVILNKTTVNLFFGFSLLSILLTWPNAADTSFLNVLNKLSTPLSLFAVIALIVFIQAMLDNEKIYLEDRISDAEREKEIFISLTHEIGSKIVAASAETEVLAIINDAAKKTTNSECAILWMKNEDGSFQTATRTGNYPPIFEVKAYILERNDRIEKKVLSDKFKEGESYPGYVVKNKRPLYLKNLMSRPHPKVMQTMQGLYDIHSLITVPVFLEGQVIGVLSVINKEGSNPNFTEPDVSMMETLADQISLAHSQFDLHLKNKEKLKSDNQVAIAADIQKGLFPQSFDINQNIDFHGYSYAAKGVGGDFYFYTKFSETKFGFVMSDVAGKGVPASLIMVMIRSVFVVSAKPDRLPSEVVSRLNNAIAGGIAQDRYATFLYYIYDAEKKEVCLCNAANQPLLIYRAKDQTFEEHDTDGMPLGIIAETPYNDKTISVSPGDILVLYTDGISEAMNKQRFQYGLDRMKECIQRNADKTTKEITETLYAEIKVFVDSAPQHDDETLFIQKIL